MLQSLMLANKACTLNLLFFVMRIAHLFAMHVCCTHRIPAKRESSQSTTLSIASRLFSFTEVPVFCPSRDGYCVLHIFTM